jgi:hypothetical protein
MIYIPPTEAEFALQLVEFILERIEERGGNTEQYEKIIDRITFDRSPTQ